MPVAVGINRGSQLLFTSTEKGPPARGEGADNSIAVERRPIEECEILICDFGDLGDNLFYFMRQQPNPYEPLMLFLVSIKPDLNRSLLY